MDLFVFTRIHYLDTWILGIWRFSNWRCSPKIRLTDDFTRATHTGETGFEVVLCASAPAPTVPFRLRILRNPQGTGLSIGLTAPEASPYWNDQQFKRASCLLTIGQKEYYEWGQIAALGEQALVVREGSVVAVEKDEAARAIRFLVNGEVVIGWRPTNLSPNKFVSLVGSIRMRWTNDEVQIVDNV